jgi:hypothetical protein
MNTQLEELLVKFSGKTFSKNEEVKAYIKQMLIDAYTLGEANTYSRIKELKKVWENEGINPEYHKTEKVHLLIHWPLLYNTIRNLIK